MTVFWTIFCLGTILLDRFKMAKKVLFCSEPNHQQSTKKTFSRWKRLLVHWKKDKKKKHFLFVTKNTTKNQTQNLKLHWQLVDFSLYFCVTQFQSWKHNFCCYLYAWNWIKVVTTRKKSWQHKKNFFFIDFSA
jgi:hypothetical protein